MRLVISDPSIDAARADRGSLHSQPPFPHTPPPVDKKQSCQQNLPPPLPGALHRFATLLSALPSPSRDSLVPALVDDFVRRKKQKRTDDQTLSTHQLRRIQHYAYCDLLPADDSTLIDAVAAAIHAQPAAHAHKPARAIFSWDLISPIPPPNFPPLDALIPRVGDQRESQLDATLGTPHPPRRNSSHVPPLLASVTTTADFSDQEWVRGSRLSDLFAVKIGCA
ncbi:hypothetical protein BDK51DRAFT_52699 [Blyttiomyces helicus]|uniref:Uncharacterized protein n=1 Tax=Blyttiomyces helicus TaxID=388810 RepID=A0A4P9WI02_9FUNG|nr:hypothetical protein BDK51DRAFT_52699 [Blyttiomyces helicus]|eukprot:RKO91068.1 hypothetical protein BDK51DRAFT_52699 [Blyttiomyces helicus]